MKNPNFMKLNDWRILATALIQALVFFAGYGSYYLLHLEKPTDKQRQITGLKDQSFIVSARWDKLDDSRSNMAIDMETAIINRLMSVGATAASPLKYEAEGLWENGTMIMPTESKVVMVTLKKTPYVGALFNFKLNKSLGTIITTDRFYSQNVDKAAEQIVTAITKALQTTEQGESQ